jgi:hypothetical protein
VEKIESDDELGARHFRVKPSKRNPDSTWNPLTQHPTPKKLTLLGVMGNVWSFQDPANGRLYRCEVDSMGNEQWYVMPPTIQHEWISLAEAARLRGVTRESIGRAIAHKRLSMVECNGKPKVCRSDVLTLTLRYRKSPVLKSTQQLAKAARSS